MAEYALKIHFKMFWTSVYISKRIEHLFTFQNVFDIITSYNYDQHSGLGSPSGPGIGISAHMMKLRHIIMMNQKS